MKPVAFSKAGIALLVLSVIAPAIWAIAGCGVSYNSTAAKSPAESSVPIITCTATPTSVMSGSSVQIAAKAMSPLGLPLSYSYGATAGSVASQGASATLNTQGTAGSITVTCKVVDTKGNAASSTTTVAVQAAAVTAANGQLLGQSGGRDAGRQRSHHRRSKQPRRPPSHLQLERFFRYDFRQRKCRDTEHHGAPAGTITVTCKVADNQGLTASATTAVTVNAPVSSPPTISCSPTPRP